MGINGWIMVDARMIRITKCVECPHYAGIGDCGFPGTKTTGFSPPLREIGFGEYSPHETIPPWCPLPKALEAGE
jgi:hypothetical protein